MNKHRIQYLIALSLLAGQGFFCFAQSKTFAIDSLNSQINFSVKHLGVLNVEGQFHKFTGNVIFNDNILHEVSCVINVLSVDTNDNKRDETLLSEVYLDAKTFPFIRFKSIKIDTNSIIGILKIKDIEKKITIPFQYIVTKDSQASVIIISTTINRKDFKLDFGTMNALIGNIIKVNIEIECF